MNFIELNAIELVATQGGTVFDAARLYLKKTIVGALILYAIDHWPDTKAGLVDGVTDGLKTHN